MVSTMRYQARCNHLGQWVILDTVLNEEEQVIESSEPDLTLEDIISVTHDRNMLATPDLVAIRIAIRQRSRRFREHCEENHIGSEEGEI